MDIENSFIHPPKSIKLNDDTIREIFSLLDLKSLAHISITCKAFHQRAIVWFGLKGLHLTQRLINTLPIMYKLEETTKRFKWMPEPYKSKMELEPHHHIAYSKLGEIDNEFGIYVSVGLRHAIIGPGNRNLAINLEVLFQSVIDDNPGLLIGCGKMNAIAGSKNDEADEKQEKEIHFYTLFDKGYFASWKLIPTKMICVLDNFFNLQTQGRHINDVTQIGNVIYANQYQLTDPEESHRSHRQKKISGTPLFFHGAGLLNVIFQSKSTENLFLEFMKDRDCFSTNNDTHLFLFSINTKKAASFKPILSKEHNNIELELSWLRDLSKTQIKKCLCNNNLLVWVNSLNELNVLNSNNGKDLQIKKGITNMRYSSLRIGEDLIFWREYKNDYGDDPFNFVDELHILHILHISGYMFNIGKPIIRDSSLIEYYWDWEFVQNNNILELQLLFSERGEDEGNPNAIFNQIFSLKAERINIKYL